MKPEMTKAYDLKVLAARLKAKGLDIAEEMIAVAVDETLDWVQESAPLSKTPYDDMGLVVIPPLRKMIQEQVDKVDGEDDASR